MDERPDFDASEIRAAERSLVAALESEDRTAWVFHYTEDAVFDGGAEHAVVGRAALLEMAAAMGPLTHMSLRPLRTAGTDGLVTVWVEASWESAAASGQSNRVRVRGVLVWRRDADGMWRVVMEHIG
jgi:ketosteroid isomerase-like protein